MTTGIPRRSARRVLYGVIVLALLLGVATLARAATFLRAPLSVASLSTYAESTSYAEESDLPLSPTLLDSLAQRAYLKASNSQASDSFGRSVAVAGNTLVVGAFSEASDATGVNGDQANDDAPYSGAAYVFMREGATWSQQAYLKASNTGEGDQFSFSVAISGDTLVVGAISEASNATGINCSQANNDAAFAGAAYVFVRNGTTWSQQAYLKASNTEENDSFGFAVAIAGDTIVVGAPGESSNATGVNGNQANNNASGSGATYVFVRSGTTWSQQAYLKASNSGEGDAFGIAVAISGNTVAVGASGEGSNATGVNGNQANNDAVASGAAYIFVRSGASWGQQAYLKASNTEAEDFFGDSIAISGDTVVVGAYGERSNATGVNGDQSNNEVMAAGAAYIFVRAGATWSQQAYVKASNTSGNGSFGISVAISGDAVVVGAPEESNDATGINGDQYNFDAAQSGAAYIFVRSDSTWKQQAYVKASNTGSEDGFGAVAISEEKVVVGATGEDSNATGVNGDQSNDEAMAAGAAYLFNVVHSVTPVLAGTGHGTVSLDPPADPPGGLYDAGTEIMVTANANPPSYFDGWSGDASGLTNPFPLTLDSDKVVTATFTLNQYQLITATIGTGQEQINLRPPGGIYDPLTRVNVPAVAADGSHFAGWSGDLQSSLPSHGLTMESNKSVTAICTFPEQTNLPYIEAAAE